MMIGSGKDTIRAQSWNGVRNMLQASVTVTDADCTPVTMVIAGTDGDGLFIQPFVDQTYTPCQANR